MAGAERDRAKTEITSDDRTDCLRLLAHDLNNPLTAIRILAEICRDAATDPEMSRDLTDIIEASDSASAMLDGLSALLRLEQGFDERTWCPLDLVDVIRKVVQRPALYRHFLLDLPQQMVLGGNAMALARALTDVLVNAVRLESNRPLPLSLSEGPPLASYDGTSTGSAEIRVRHPAPGVPPSQRERLFELYGAVEIRQSNTPVSAVGLAHARKVIADHGGRILFEDGPGGAMDLVIRLPR